MNLWRGEAQLRLAPDFPAYWNLRAAMAAVEVPSSAERDPDSVPESPEEPLSGEPSAQELANAYEMQEQLDAQEAMYSRESRRRLLSPPDSRRRTPASYRPDDGD